ncbi:uncharacterized protein yc1106_09131 [Curvularia clavata]|uniref:Uncharacterized protein n=1 Tax=Curvularia clavata TaxID=95742 RepID=A0A9Q8ZH50_CURCL|nr:uncharacterized protein yc1106_09131 [Curvularia clavata]
MAHQMPVTQPAQYPGPVPQQHQNTASRHTSSTQQSFGQIMPGEAPGIVPDTIQGPLLVSFILEKPRNATSWEDVVPEQQHVTVHDLKKEVHKFRRNHNSVKKALNEISSPNCRRIINELVEEQNVALAKLNPAMEYRIVSVVNKFRERNSLTRRERHLVRVDIILEAEDSHFQATRMGVEMSSNEPDHSRTREDNGQPQVQSHINHPNQHMLAQQQMPQQRPQHHVPHNMGPPQHSEALRVQPPLSQGNNMPMNGQHPPPPPPPPHIGGGTNGQAQMPGPPPPPPIGGGRPAMSGPHMQQPSMQQPPMQQPPMQHRSAQGLSRMPGSYPEAMPMPGSVPGQRPGPVNETMDAELLRSLRAKYKNHTDTSSLFSESDISWEDESGSSSFVDIQNISHDETSGREHGRGRHVKKTKKTSKYRVHSRGKRQSHSRSRSRSRSRSHPRRAVHEQHAQRPERRHRTNSDINDRHNTRRSPATSGSSSPQPGHAKLSSQVPASIHIHMNTPNTGEDRTRSGNAPPISVSHEKKKAGKVYTSHDEISEASWDRASGSDSWNTASTNPAEDGTWDIPLRNASTRRDHKPVSQQRPSYTEPRSPRYPRDHSTENIPTPTPLRSSMRDRSRERSRERYFTSHPPYTPRPDLPHRRNTASLPFPTSSTVPRPPKLPRALSFTPAPATHEAYQPRRSQRDSSDEQINLRDLKDALEWARERRKEESEREVGGRGGRYVDGMGGRRGRRDSGVYDEDDEWAYGFDGGRGKGYGGY